MDWNDCRIADFDVDGTLYEARSLRLQMALRVCWGAVVSGDMRLPLFIKAGDGAYMPYSQQVDGIAVGNTASRRKLVAEAGRRPRFLNRRKPGIQPDA